ncbi:MAG: hypothetical protein KC731_33920 [Myxococcales bacterium]|nr:hypothetical protein [Myxococcales bacterium]
MPDSMGPDAPTMAAVGLEVAELVKAVPRMLWRGIVGGASGAVLGALLGLGAVLAGRAAGWIGSGTAGLVASAISVVVCGAGGGYVGGLRGAALALARTIDERGWVASIWAAVRPRVQRYVEGRRAGVAPSEARSTALAESGEDASPGLSGLAERVERWVVSLLAAALTGGVLGAALEVVDGQRDATWAEVEVEGLRVAREAVGDVVSGAFHGPMLVGLALTVLVAVAPHALAVLVGA